MKKLVLIIVTAMVLISCGNEPMYTEAQTLVYNYDSEGNPVLFSTDVHENLEISNFKNDKGVLIKDEASPLSLQLITSPAEVSGTNFDGKPISWDQQKGYVIKQTVENDTLYLAYGPTENTPAGFLRVGLIYKFYKK